LPLSWQLVGKDLAATRSSSSCGQPAARPSSSARRAGARAEHAAGPAETKVPRPSPGGAASHNWKGGARAPPSLGSPSPNCSMSNI
jgi:hypothetical protein